jgi:Fe-S cluster assembly ATP-binding protein
MRHNSNTLKIKDLCVQIEGQELIHNLNLTIPEGEVHVLLGPNGCGKTTLIMTIMGFPAYEVTKGQIVFDGSDITGLGLTERARLGIREKSNALSFFSCSSLTPDSLCWMNLIPELT